jgi:hypothetical protein
VNDFGGSSADVGDKSGVVNHAGAIMNCVTLNQIIDLRGVKVDVQSGETSTELFE